MKTIGLTLALLLATAVQAQEKQTPEEGCQQLIQAYSQLEVKAAQAGLVADIQKGIVSVCRRLIELEKAAAVPTPVPTPVEEVK